MSEPTNEQVIEDLKQKLAATSESLTQATETIKRQTAQINNLRENVGTVKDLSEEVAADVRERMAAGLPREIAIERALAQHSHNKNLAKAKAAAATETKPGKAK